ncbi:glycoside hydrolase family 85 protein, partial [Collybiopsis luxurians FD-317 M1]
SFSHHRVTIPPPGWINAAHRQGVKMLGTLIFEGGGEQDCLRLLVGRLPNSRTGTVSQPLTTTSLPISPHYARILADLARQRGFDGYLLNFECPLAGGIEQTRALAAWITLLRFELKAKVGSHAEAMWYDSVIIDGRLAWQDRLNSVNLPFFLSSSSFFSNYTWRNDYPSLTAQYFLSLDSSLAGDANSHPHIDRKKLQDIYMGVDVWGRGSHGNGGFGSFKAISHISPSSLGLSVALFGQAWTWESEQDKLGWTWDAWWTYERKLWAGKADPAEEIPDPKMPPPRNDEPPCEHNTFIPITSFFQHTPPPDPIHLPFHTTFSPGVGRRWFVKGEEVFHRAGGWTDVDKQTSLGDLVWPKPAVSWEGEIMVPEGLDLPEAKSQICMDDAWNGGSSLRLNLNAPGTQSENAAFRCIWLPVQSLTITAGRVYEAEAFYKLETELPDADVDVALSIKATPSPPSQSSPEPKVTPFVSQDSNSTRGWTNLKIHFVFPNLPAAIAQSASIGLVVTVVTEDTTRPLALSFLLGQLNVYPCLPPSIPPHVPSLIWADFRPAASTGKETGSSSSPATTPLGFLTWDVAASLPPVKLPLITSPDDPVAAWPGQPSAQQWFPRLLYSNIYVLEYREDGSPGDVKDAVWIGTSGCGYEGMRNTFTVDKDIDLSSSVRGDRSGVVRVGSGKTRFYVQGVTEKGEVLDWTRCAFVDV